MVQASRPNAVAKRLTPRTTEQREQDEQECKLPIVSEDESLDGDDEDGEEEEVYLASAQTESGSLDHTNQTSRYADEEYLTPEAARERMLLENHRQRMSFMEHMVVQTPENINQQLQKMEPDMADKMLQLQNISAQKVRDADSRKKAIETNKRLAKERQVKNEST